MAKGLTFRFDTFGDRNTASSRLRAWRLGDFLAERGHRVLMNEGSACDIYVCQKVRPFETLRHFREKGALVVYDFDDHLLLVGPEGHGIRDEVVAFINAADLVTVGSEYLLREARRYHGNVADLENPADIGSADLVREKTPELRCIGWFGTPAGLTELGAVDTAETVRTITRGGPGAARMRRNCRIPSAKWRRLSADIFALLAERLPGPVGATFALMASDPASLRAGATLRRTEEQSERELESVYERCRGG